MPWKDWSTLLIRKGSKQEGLGGKRRRLDGIGKPRKT